MRQSVTYKEKSEGFANQTFRLLLVGRSRSGFSSPDSDTNYTLGLAVETITVSSMLYSFTDREERHGYSEYILRGAAEENVRGISNASLICL